MNRWENCQSDRIHEINYISLEDYRDSYDRFYNYCEELALKNNVPLCDYVQAVAKSDNYFIVEFNIMPQKAKVVFEFDDVDNNGSLKVTTYTSRPKIDEELKDVCHYEHDFTEICHYVVLDGEYDS